MNTKLTVPLQAKFGQFIVYLNRIVNFTKNLSNDS